MKGRLVPRMSDPKPGSTPPRDAFATLRLRLWAACIAGGVIAGVGSLWVLGTRATPGAADFSELLGWLAGVAFASLLAGLLFAVWLDHHIVGHLRGLLRGVRTGRVVELRGLPGASGWGELSELSDAMQAMLTRQRQGARAEGEREKLQAQLEQLRAALAGWMQREVWEAPALPDGPVAELVQALGHAFARRETIDTQNRESARQVARVLGDALGDAQESAEQAERGFVEATAMLTTVRELQRLSGELQNALAALGTASSAPQAQNDARLAAREALEDLVAASGDSVASIGQGLLRVQDVADQVQQLANRATLIAIQVVTGAREGGAGEALANDLKVLAREVREATDRTTRFALDIETAVGQANARMKAAREEALARLEALPVTPAPGVAGLRAYDDAQRLHERVREMVQDAARKGERLSAAGERASRAAERLSRRVDEGAVDAEALVVRLAPVGGADARAAARSSTGLHLLASVPTETGDESHEEPRDDSRDDSRDDARDDSHDDLRDDSRHDSRDDSHDDSHDEPDTQRAPEAGDSEGRPS